MKRGDRVKISDFYPLPDLRGRWGVVAGHDQFTSCLWVKVDGSQGPSRAVHIDYVDRA